MYATEIVFFRTTMSHDGLLLDFRQAYNLMLTSQQERQLWFKRLGACGIKSNDCKNVIGFTIIRCYRQLMIISRWFIKFSHFYLKCMKNEAWIISIGYGSH